MQKYDNNRVLVPLQRGEGTLTENGAMHDFTKWQNIFSLSGKIIFGKTLPLFSLMHSLQILSQENSPENSHNFVNFYFFIYFMATETFQRLHSAMLIADDIISG